MDYSPCVEVRGQLLGISSCLPPCWSSTSLLTGSWISGWFFRLYLLAHLRSAGIRDVHLHTHHLTWALNQVVKLAWQGLTFWIQNSGKQKWWGPCCRIYGSRWAIIPSQTLGKTYASIQKDRNDKIGQAWGENPDYLLSQKPGGPLARLYSDTVCIIYYSTPSLRTCQWAYLWSFHKIY